MEKKPKIEKLLKIKNTKRKNTEKNEYWYNEAKSYKRQQNKMQKKFVWLRFRWRIKETNHTKNWQKRCQQGIQNKHMSQWRTASFFGACKTGRFGYLSKKLWRVCIWKMFHKWYRAFLPLWMHLLSIHFFYFMFNFHLTRHL